MGGGSFYWELSEIVEGGLWKWSISLWGGALSREPRRVCKGRLWKKAFLFIGPPLGEPGVCSFTRNFERRMKEGSGNGEFLSVGALSWEPGGGDSFSGDPEGYVKDGSEDVHLSP